MTDGHITDQGHYVETVPDELEIIQPKIIVKEITPITEPLQPTIIPEKPKKKHFSIRKIFRLT